MQVVTNANMVDLIQGKAIPEFKPPEAPKTTESPAAEIKPKDEGKPSQAAPVSDADKPREPVRGEDGKFVKAGDKPADGEQKAEGDKPDAGEKKAEADDDVVLTKKIERLINKKHRAMKEAEEFGANEARRAIAAEQRAEALQRQIDELRGVKSDGAKPDGKPRKEDFKTVGDYAEALVEYHAREAGKKSQAQAQTERQQANTNAVIGEFVKRQEAFKAATPDYEDVLEAADFEVPPLAHQYLIESEMGPQLAYHLAKNPDAVTSLRKLSPGRLFAELGKLEAKLEKPADAPKTAAAGSSNGVSKAPAPIQPLEAKTTPVVKDPKDMSFQELRAHRLAEARAKRA